MGCIRAEDLSAAKWAIGLRVTDSTDDSIALALNQGSILWTYVLQPVKHFISPDDIYWMLALTAPRLKAINKGLFHSLGIDASLLKKSKRIISRALEKGQMTRTQLSEILEMGHTRVDDLRLGMLLMDAELDGIICSGVPDGGHFRYALLEERVPMVKRRSREESLGELAKRYFLSRGPATLSDLSAWSGLSSIDVETGLEISKRWLQREVVDGQVYYFHDAERKAAGDPSVFLLPAFDELAAAYMGNVHFKPAVIVDGQPSGTWTRILRKDKVHIEVTTPLEQDKDLRTAIWQQAKRYSDFINKKLML